MLNDRKDAFEKWWTVYPPERRVKKSATRMAFDMAIYSIQKDRECDEVAAIAHLHARTERFAKSSVAHGQFCWSSERWLAEQHWEDADEAWGYKRPQYVGTAVAKQVAAKRAVPKDEQQNPLEGLYGEDVDSLSDDEVYSILKSPSARGMFRLRGKTGTVRDLLLKAIAERAVEIAKAKSV